MMVSIRPRCSSSLVFLPLFVATSVADDPKPAKAPAIAEPSWDFQSPKARDAKKKFDAAYKEAETGFARTVSKARKVLVEDLEMAMKTATQAADLAEAVKLRAAIVFLKQEASGPGHPKLLGRPLGATELLTGRWSLTFTTGVVATCEVRKDGTVVETEMRRRAMGRTALKDGAIVVGYLDNRFERWTPVGTKMIVEHWAERAMFPTTLPVFGYAERAK